MKWRKIDILIDFSKISIVLLENVRPLADFSNIFNGIDIFDIFAMKVYLIIDVLNIVLDYVMSYEFRVTFGFMSG